MGEERREREREGGRGRRGAYVDREKEKNEAGRRTKRCVTGRLGREMCLDERREEVTKLDRLREGREVKTGLKRVWEADSEAEWEESE